MIITLAWPEVCCPNLLWVTRKPLETWVSSYFHIRILHKNMTRGLKTYKINIQDFGEWAAGHPHTWHRTIIIYYLNYVLKSSVKRDKHLPRRSRLGWSPGPLPVASGILCPGSCAFRTCKEMYLRGKLCFPFFRRGLGGECVCVPAHMLPL